VENINLYVDNDTHRNYRFYYTLFGSVTVPIALVPPSTELAAAAAKASKQQQQQQQQQQHMRLSDGDCAQEVCERQ
jgi:hypothetical protein